MPANKITIEHDGDHYSGHYSVTDDTLSVFHSLATKKASLGGLPPEGLAHQLLFEIVVRQGQGKPDSHSSK